MTEIAPGQVVLIRVAGGDTVERRAVTGVLPGDTFPVVWACRKDEWEVAQREQREPDAVPWPAEDVQGAHAAPTASHRGVE